MIWIKRKLEDIILPYLGKNKVVLILGTRRVGKTMLAHALKQKHPGKTLMLNAEDFDVQELLKNRSVANYTRIVGDATLLVLDEAQALPDVGYILKLMIDYIPHLTILATGSSSFDLTNKTGEPLTGRALHYHLYPFSQTELGMQENLLQTRQNLDDRLIFGCYPEVVQMTDPQEKTAYLTQLVQSYLLKDILAYQGIRHADKLIKLLRLIAYQVGAEVSYTELATQLGMSKNTVENYLDLLSKVFIVYKLGAYSTKPRKEVSKSSKWFFYDNGIRNAIINDFRWMSLRNDCGLLWENYLIAERIKKNAYTRRHAQLYFWRSYSQQEIDLIEVANGSLSAFEFKYSAKRKTKLPPAFATAYPEVPFQVITQDTYLDWIC